jgi:hypothetical protein
MQPMTTLLNNDASFLQRGKVVLAVSFLLLQLCLILWARFIPERWFCWAPHDAQTQYELTVVVNGQALSPEEISGRYRRHKIDREVRAAANIKAIIMQRERTYGRNDTALITMNYRINGIPQKPWQWSSKP